jgi:Uncharacterised nucleotidyltransferase
MAAPSGPVNQEFVNREVATPTRHDTSSTSFEWNLLLAASADDGRPSRLDSLLNRQPASVDWQAVLRRAHFHGASALLYQNLASRSGLLPAQVIESLRQRYVANVQRSLLLSRELNRILDHVHASGIELISYKGIVLSQLYYGGMAMRQAGDLDLFVRKPDLIRTRSALRDLGYVTSRQIPEESEKHYIASGYEYSFDSSTEKHLLELQWALQPRYYAVDYDMDGLFARAVDVTAAGRSLKIPSPEDLLLILCIHAAKHVWGRLIWLRDVAQILQRGNLDFDCILSRARELGIVRILHLTLLLANQFLEMPLPAAITTAIHADRAAHAFAEEIAPSIVDGILWEDYKMPYFRLMMRLRERRRDQLRFLSRLAFTPGPGEWQAVNLPRPLSPLYRAIRMARLAARFSTILWRGRSRPRGFTR